MASGGQEKSLNESKPKFSITKAFSSAVQFLANQVSIDKCKQILSGFHSLNAVLQEQTAKVLLISLSHCYGDLKKHVQFGV